MTPPTFGTSRTRTPLGVRVPLTESEFLVASSKFGIRYFRAGRTAIFALHPTSERRPSASAYEVTPEDAARFLFHEHLWRGEPILEPYLSATDGFGERLGFRWAPNAAAREYKREARALRRGVPGTPR